MGTDQRALRALDAFIDIPVGNEAGDAAFLVGCRTCRREAVGRHQRYRQVVAPAPQARFRYLCHELWQVGLLRRAVNSVGPIGRYINPGDCCNGLRYCVEVAFHHGIAFMAVDGANAP